LGDVHDSAVDLQATTFSSSGAASPRQTGLRDIDKVANIQEALRQQKHFSAARCQRLIIPSGFL
jgi:hypothetical protein